MFPDEPGRNGSRFGAAEIAGAKGEETFSCGIAPNFWDAINSIS
jgi:hypothetical protein